MPKLLVVIAGPTAVGKTSFVIHLATQLNTHILSCDSRQFYREMQIGTAVPSDANLAMVPHHFIGNLSITDYFNAARYETEALGLLEKLFTSNQIVLVCGGSGLYINALCHGIDELPDPDPVLRQSLKENFEKSGIGHLQKMLKHLDPAYYQNVDLQNTNRLLRAIEVSLLTGRPYSGLLLHQVKPRPFNVLKIVLNRPREELFERISLRTNEMIRHGLVDEVSSLKGFRHLNALKTLGYKEIFEYLDGNIMLEQAIADIKTNTRRYAKRQLTWFKKDSGYHWFHPDRYNEVLALIASTFDRLT